ALFEKDQPEVRVEDEDVGILFRQTAINHLGLREGVGLEVDESEKIQNVRIIRPQLLRALQLPSGLGVPTFLERFAPAVVVEEKNTLIEGRTEIHRRIEFRH